MNPDPALIRNAQWMHWHGYPQQLSAAWEQPVDDWSGPEWITVPGARLSSLTVAKILKISIPKTSIKNQFEALSEEGPVEDSEPPHRTSCGCSEACKELKVGLMDAVKMPSRNKSKTTRRMMAFKESGEHAMETLQTDNMKPILKMKKRGVMDDQVKSAVPRSRTLPSIVVADLNRKEEQSVMPESSVAWPGLKVFAEKRPQSLRPLAGANEGGWEYLEAILDSGATVTVIPPHVGKEYEVVPSAASKAGVKYEVANGDEIPNLGEKLLPVVTNEGSWRGMLAQVADVSTALQSVRALVKSGHVVVFGDESGGPEN